MDLASGAKRLIITMNHTEADGSPKIVPRCTLPLTATSAVDLIITELAVFDFAGPGLRLVEPMPGVSVEEIRAKTGSTFHFQV